jgi:hypothetical protein
VLPEHVTRCTNGRALIEHPCSTHQCCAALDPFDKGDREDKTLRIERFSKRYGGAAVPDVTFTSLHGFAVLAVSMQSALPRVAPL